MTSLIQFAHDHAAAILGALFAISEALAYIPGVKANSIFQAVQNGLKKILDMVSKPTTPSA